MVNLVCEAIIPDGPMKEVKEIENSIRTTYKKSIWGKFVKAVNDFDLIEDGDKIAIGVSGGKDSLLLVKLFHELKKDRSRNFEFKAVSLNPGFRESDLSNFKRNLENLNIDCAIIDTNIWEIANEKAKDYPCFLCAKMRRGILYKKVEELGYNKLTLGHHFDDVIENTKENGIRPMNCGCTIEAGRTSSKRREVKDLLASLEKKNPGIKQSIFNSMRNINLDYVFGYSGGDK